MLLWQRRSMSEGSALLATAQQKFQSSCVFHCEYTYMRIIKWLRLDPNVPIAVQAQAALFHGLYLDPRYANQKNSGCSFNSDPLLRSSAVYGAFFFIGTFLLGVMRAYIPNLTLLTIFATIVLDMVSIYNFEAKLHSPMVLVDMHNRTS